MPATQDRRDRRPHRRHRLGRPVRCWPTHGLLPIGDKLLQPDEAVVGVLLSAGDSQMTLRRGAVVAWSFARRSVTRAPRSRCTGWVFDASAEAVSARERPVEIAVSRDQAALVSAAGADKRVTIVILPE